MHEKGSEVKDGENLHELNKRRKDKQLSWVNFLTNRECLTAMEIKQQEANREGNKDEINKEMKRKREKGKMKE